MMIADPVADLLTRINNAAERGRKEVVVPFSKMKQGIAQILISEGYLDGSEVVQAESNPVHQNLKLNLKYFGRRPAIRGTNRVSKPGVRVYVGYREIPRVKNGLGICLLSTSRGIMTGKAAKEDKVGGELLCYVW